MVAQGHQGSDAHHVKELNDKQTDKGLHEGAPGPTSDSDHVGGIDDGQSKPVAALKDVDHAAFAPHIASIQEAGPFAIRYTHEARRFMAQSADPVGHHVKGTVALDYDQVQTVEKAQHKKGYQKANDEAQKGPVTANPSA